MNNTQSTEEPFYWSVDMPGMTADQALNVASILKGEGVDLGMILVNPANFLTLHLDRESVEAIVAGLSSANANPVSAGLRESLDEWLAWLDTSS